MNALSLNLSNYIIENYIPLGSPANLKYPKDVKENSYSNFDK